MRALFFLLLFLSGGCAVNESRKAALPDKLRMPRAAAWRMVDSESYVEAVAVCDGRWRKEGHAHRKPLVAVFDGTSFVCTSTNPAATAKLLSPGPEIERLYDDLTPVTSDTPVVQMDGALCWHFIGQRVGDEQGELWVDTRTKFLRRLTLHSTNADYSVTYRLLALDVKREAVRLFNTNNLELILFDLKERPN